MTNTTPSETDLILTSMLTENTGRHMLDSGGAYGRNWERNQGLTAEALIAAPAVTYDDYGVTLNVFHWLRDRLTYDAELDRKFEVWNALYFEHSPWLEVMEAFAAKVQTGDANRSLTDGYLTGTTNSYNHENSLSQTIQFTVFQDQDDEPCVLLQIHGGADVRGGYTQARAFRVAGGEVGDLFDFDGFSLWHHNEGQSEALPGMPVPDMHALDHRNTEWVDYGGSFVSDPWDGEDWMSEAEDGTKFIRCPYCTEPTPMNVDKYPI